MRCNKSFRRPPRPRGCLNEILVPLHVTHQKTAAIHFRHYGTIGKKFDDFVLVRACAFCHSLLRTGLAIEIAHGTHLVRSITLKIEELVHRSGVIEG